MENNRKELVVSAIENGTVIDHIPNDMVSTVIKILNLYKMTNEIVIGANLESKKFGKKGIIKVKDIKFETSEINKIALVAPSASIIEIENYQVSNKFKVTVPKNINGIVKCFNPKCITNVEQAKTKFEVLDAEDLKLLCHYCEKITKKGNVEFL